MGQRVARCCLPKKSRANAGHTDRVSSTNAAGGGAGNGAKVLNPDDKWSNLYREREKNHLYKWVGSRNGKLPSGVACLSCCL